MTTAREGEMSEATFRYMESEDLERAFELVMLAFGEQWPKLAIGVPRLEHLRWKLSGPRSAPTDPEVVEIDGRIVGYVGGSSRDMWLQGKRAPGFYGGDYCVHPDFQGRGLIGAWTTWRNEQVEPDFVGVSEGSTHPRLIRFTRRRKGRALVANKVDRLTLPLSVAAIARGGGESGSRMTARSLFRAARTVAKMWVGRWRWRRLPESSAAPSVRSIETFDERADVLWERARDGFDLTVVRDQEHLNWRYCDPRAGVYRVRAVQDDDELRGFMVTGSIGRAAQVVDLLTVPGDVDALRALVDDAVAFARADGAATVTVMMPRRHPYRETFLRCGFIRWQQVGAMGFTRREDSLLDFLEDDRAARIHVAFGDSDHI